MSRNFIRVSHTIYTTQLPHWRSFQPEAWQWQVRNIKHVTRWTIEWHEIFFNLTARSVANIQAAIEHIYPLVFEFKKPRAPKETVKEEEEILKAIVNESEDDDDSEGFEELDPLEIEPPKKKTKLSGDVRDISHLTKRFKGGRAKRPPGKMNDPSEDLIYVSDCDDPDDF